MASFDTRTVHAGRQDLRKLGVHAPPIDLSTTYPITGLEEARASIDRMMEGAEPDENPIYSRLHNPTVARFEAGIAQLEEAEAAVGFASGMAAMTACLLAARQRGERVVAVRPMYGGTDGLLSSGLLGVEVDWADAESVGAAIGPQTSLVIVETPANPTLQLVDIEHVVAQAGDVPVLVDSTFATPVLQQPLRHGAAMVLHSGTKFIGGHGDVIAGVVATSEAFARELRVVRSLTGGILHPRAAYDLHRGLQTLSLRVHKAQEGARLLAGRLHEHRAVGSVHYPGFQACDPKGLVGRQMAGPGSMLAFELVGGFDAALRVMEAVELITPAVSLGSTDTLIQHPAGLTHRKVDAEVRASHGITDGFLRLSVGVEDAEDLWQELGGILDGLSRA
ncbi:aminotransferase class I/II-fold pyridoxal phosphate-dependent enzyme [Persicimonas caeni]|uniref:Aminotransferase class I/II-fold pyridoxal phosphate-dependent enzyme n=1 Tax=Persicimonas caeni TaxID=2292766 RepID=A0A4Y6PY77_PERCE|nr:aminotransferase class I/II-fold pyridoxal phosphate-dependent enzyme [Persicimonas caeni]QDG53284.1 aminotransferase class I/II-fold pyridoxal phosphate-dependent enzyme [Persicimonas caeni]QED34506.1 aminotransferase class I/II-fold pyridoxal phosphate-dependent enzyme [Persicimonas caeni]